MHITDESKIRALEAPVSRREVTLSGLAGRFLKALGRLFQPKFDYDRLTPRLRRDAGVDELELERTRAARVPLIR
jgi:hypothetical protein